jgi:hypothetical protein
VLLAVIFSFDLAPDIQMAKESGDSENNGAVFSRITVKKPSGTGKWRSNRGDPGVCFWECLDSGDNPGMDKTPLYSYISPFRYPSPI